MASKPNRKQVKELKADCLVESTLKIWFEIGGKGGGKQEEKKKGKGQEMGEEVIQLSGLGVNEEKGGWTPIERMTTRKTYDRLIKTRMRLKDYVPKKAHATVHSIQKMLTAAERDYWWRLTHRAIQTRTRMSKWKKEHNGEMVTKMCVVYKTEEEDWDHYYYECK